MGSSQLRTRVSGVAVLGLVLTGCSGGAATDSPTAPATSATQAASDAPTQSSETTTAPDGEADADATTDGASDDELAGGPSSCGAITLEEDSTVPGDVLATCMVDYLAFAGSGASEMTSDTSSSRMVWRMADAYEAYAEVDGGIRIVANGDAAWIDLDGDGWVKVDPTTPGMELAFGIVEAWRETSAPEVTRAMIAAAPVWEVGPRQDIDLPDGTTQNLSGVRAAEPFEWGGATIDDMTFWMAEPGKIILQEATATALGFSATSATHFTQWGGEVDIPDPASE